MRRRNLKTCSKPAQPFCRRARIERGGYTSASAGLQVPLTYQLTMHLLCSESHHAHINYPRPVMHEACTSSAVGCRGHLRQTQAGAGRFKNMAAQLDGTAPASNPRAFKQRKKSFILLQKSVTMQRMLHRDLLELITKPEQRFFRRARNTRGGYTSVSAGLRVSLTYQLTMHLLCSESHHAHINYPRPAMHKACTSSAVGCRGHLRKLSENAPLCIAVGNTLDRNHEQCQSKLDLRLRCASKHLNRSSPNIFIWWCGKYDFLEVHVVSL